MCDLFLTFFSDFNTKLQAARVELDEEKCVVSIDRSRFCISLTAIALCVFHKRKIQTIFAIQMQCSKIDRAKKGCATWGDCFFFECIETISIRICFVVYLSHFS